MRRGGKKRDEPTSSSEESPPKAQGASPDKLKANDPKPLEHSPSKLEEIARHHMETRSSIILNLTNEQIAEMGFRIFKKWVQLRGSSQKKSGTLAKKPKLATEEEQKDKQLPEEQKDKQIPEEQRDKQIPEGQKDKPIPEEHEDKPLPEDETDMVDLVNEEVKSLDSARFEVEIEYVKSFSSTESEDDPEARLRQDGWERYLFRKDATKHHSAVGMMVITCRDSAHMVDRLTASMSELKLRMKQPSSPDHSPEELDTFFSYLERTKERLIGKGARRSHKSSKWDASGSSKDKPFEKKPDNPPSDDDEMGSRV